MQICVYRLRGGNQRCKPHAEFVRMHPFLYGNGRTSRLLMNYQLMAKGFLPVYIAKEDRLAYYNALDQYAAHGRLNDFAV